MKQKTQIRQKMALKPMELIEALIALAAPTDKPSHQRFLKILSEAIDKYQGKDKNLFLRAIYSITRQRGQSFEDAKINIEKIKDPIAILQIVLKLISTGKWKAYSGNTCLVYNMITCLEEYEGEDPDYIRYQAIPFIKDGFILKAEETLIIEQAEFARKARLDAELALLNSKSPEESNVVLFKKEESRAVKFAEKKSSKSVFFLKLDKDKLTLTWIDHMGHAERLPLTPEQHFTLKQGMPLVESSSSSHKKAKGKLSAEECNRHFKELKLKALCKKILCDFLDHQVPLLINPKKMPSEFISTFLIQTRLDGGTIDWFDAFGRKLSIDLALYPKLRQWMIQVPIFCMMQKREATAEERLALQTLLLHVPTRQNVDEEKQAIAQKNLQEKFGLSLSLVATNDLEKLPAFKRIPGTYFLTREPANTRGNWVLYLREKGGINTPVNIAKWKKFNETLVGLKDLMPEKIDAVSLNTLRSCISQMTVKAKPVSCLAVNDFKPEDVALYPTLYPAVSFIATKRDGIWQLYFIDILNKVLQVDLNEVSEAAEILKLWQDEPDMIEQASLNALKICLADYRLVSQINPDDYVEVRKSIGRQIQSFTGEKFSGEKEADLPSIQSQKPATKCGKLDLNNYEITKALGHVPKAPSLPSSLQQAATPRFFKPVPQLDNHSEIGPGNAP